MAHGQGRLGAWMPARFAHVSLCSPLQGCTRSVWLPCCLKRMGPALRGLAG